MEGWYSSRCVLTWKLRGTKYNRSYCQLRASTLPIKEKGFGLLPTHQAMDCMNNPPRKISPTGRIKSNQGQDGSAPLKDLAMNGLLPTPTADDNPAKNTGKRKQDSLQKRSFQITGETSQLNPLFVAEMMGFPVDWTVLPFLSGETNQSKHTATAL